MGVAYSVWAWHTVYGRSIQCMGEWDSMAHRGNMQSGDTYHVPPPRGGHIPCSSSQRVVSMVSPMTQKGKQETYPVLPWSPLWPEGGEQYTLQMAHCVERHH